jgi:hypothetical protein
MGSIARPGSLVPINRRDRPKRFRSWLSRSEPLPTIRNAASGHAKNMLLARAGQEFSFQGGIFSRRGPGIRPSRSTNKAQGTLEPKPAAHFPEHSKPRIFRHLGPCDRKPSVDLRNHLCAGLCRPAGANFRVAPGTSSSEDSLSHPTAVCFLERLQRLRP